MNSSGFFCKNCKRALEKHTSSELVNCSLIMIDEVKT
jgi:hypothetical protein